MLEPGVQGVPVAPPIFGRSVNPARHLLLATPNVFITVITFRHPCREFKSQKIVNSVSKYLNNKYGVHTIGQGGLTYSVNFSVLILRGDSDQGSQGRLLFS